jgi:trehalose utilization protein
MRVFSRRSFVVHSAHTTIGVSAGLAAFQAAEATPDVAVAGAAATALNVCLVSGAPSYESDESLAALAGYLQRRLNVDWNVARRTAVNDLPGLDNLAVCDCMVLFAQRMAIDGEQLDCIKRYCDRGGPIVAIRSAGCALANWPALDRGVLGVMTVGNHGRTRKPLVRLENPSIPHPILDGVEPFRAGGSLCKVVKVASDADCLLTATVPGHREPVAWTRNHRGGRTFSTTLGHPADFRQSTFLRMLANAVTWTARHDASLM